MNIDVREYLRINPISVHELTLSDNDNDCFLFFPNENSQNWKYKVVPQGRLFKSLQNSIFGNLINFEATPPAIKPYDPEHPIELDGKFKTYARRSDVNGWKTTFDGKLANFESGLDDIILELRRKGVLDYAGAVELQSNNTR
jgi:hypothetical protein